MNRKFSTAMFMCGFLIFSVSVNAATMPSIQGSVYEMGSMAAISGAQIELYADDGNAVFDGGDSMITSVATDGSGSYVFESLGAGQSYFVVHNGEVSQLQSPDTVSMLIDGFDLTQSVIADPVSVSRMDSITGPSSSIFGEARDLYLEIAGGSADGKFRVNPFSLNSNLQIDMASGVTGRAIATWDGVAGATGMEPDHGLDADFTGGGLYEGIGLRLAVDAAGAGQLLQLLIHSGAGNVSTAEIEFPVEPNVEPTESRFVAFEDFVGDADFENVSAFQLLIDAEMPSLDAQIDLVGLQGASTVNFAVIPEPSAVLLALAGFVAALGYRGSRRKR